MLQAKNCFYVTCVCMIVVFSSVVSGQLMAEEDVDNLRDSEMVVALPSNGANAVQHGNDNKITYENSLSMPVSSSLSSAPASLASVNEDASGKAIDWPRPPNWVLWVSAFLAISKFFLDVVSWISSKFEKTRERNRSITDDFWYRTIILPIFLEPMLEFINEHSKKLRLIDDVYQKSPDEDHSDQYKSYLESFQSGLRHIINRALMLSASHESLYEVVSMKLDSLEDGVATHCVERAYGGGIEKVDFDNHLVTEAYFFEVARDIIVQLKERHNKLF